MALHPDRLHESRRLAGIALCAGFGGLELGLHIAEPGYQTVCYALVARMEDQALDHAPVWDDVRTFGGRPWRGKVHIVSAGYPCQPFSFAGRQRGTSDPRHLWPHVARVAREARPEWIFCENVEGHVDVGFAEVAGELSRMGFTIKAGLFSAAEVGAAHIRRRLFILAHANDVALLQPRAPAIRRARLSLRRRPRADRKPDRDRPDGARLDALVAACEDHRRVAARAGDVPLFSPAPCDFAAWGSILRRRPDLQPEFFGLVDGVAHRLDRSRGAGNGVVALAAAYAFRTLKAAFTAD
ncbi:MAG: DNA cytosine methyltransferase [Xanthobacteraceae bacterium]